MKRLFLALVPLLVVGGVVVHSHHHTPHTPTPAEVTACFMDWKYDWMQQYGRVPLTVDQDSARAACAEPK